MPLLTNQTKPKQTPRTTADVRPEMRAEAGPALAGLNLRCARSLLQLRRGFAILRYYRNSQLASRAVSICRRQLLQLSGGGRFALWPQTTPATTNSPQLATIANRMLEARRTIGHPLTVDDLRRRRLRLIGIEATLQGQYDWRLTGRHGISHLWRFHFHYHEFLLDILANTEADEVTQARNAVWEFVLSWIDGNSVADPQTYDDAWHPFCISRRLPVWIALFHLIPPDEQIAPRVLCSLVQQGRFLCDHLEWDVGGNHLLENIRALAVASGFLEGREPQRWLRRVKTILPEQLDQQILAHGEHFERSPMYHAAMLGALLDIRDALEVIDPATSNSSGATARHMAAFLQSILHPDGEFPLFADSAQRETPPARFLVREAFDSNGQETIPVPSSLPQTSAPSPYWSWRDGGDCLIFDAGDVGARHLPAHAHCDLLNIEASVGGERFVVDSGVYSYDDDPMRRYCRSTSAHNALQVDDADHCDVWSRFRMGFRGHVSEFTKGTEHGFHWARAAHDAYRRQGVPHVGRWIACRAGGPWFIIDWALGTGRHLLTNRLHLHPNVQIVESTQACILAKLHEHHLSIYALGTGELTIADGWYCPEFGQRSANLVLEQSSHGPLPGVCGWMLTRQTCAEVPRVSVEPAGIITIVWKDEAETLCWELPTRTAR